MLTRRGNADAGRDAAAPPVLLIAPPPVATLTGFRQMFAGAPEKSRQFGAEYARVAAEFGCAFLDAGTVIRSSDLDGIHFEPGEHKKLGDAVDRVEAALASGLLSGLRD